VAAAPDAAGILRDVARAVADAIAPVYVGFSGGLDSTVLLHAATRAPLRVPVVALHVNHGLQADADAWEVHCRAVAAELGVECVVARVQVERRGSVEAAARAARYAAFLRHLVVPGSRLLLAHHRDDQAETVLLRLLQGRGLYGMPAARPIGAGHLLRPLLDHPRSALQAHARAAGLRWIEDPSNTDVGLDRNFVRHRVLPLARQRFPALDVALLGALEARIAEDGLLLREPAVALDSATLPIDLLLARPPAEQQAWLRLWLAARGCALPTGRALREFLAQLHAAPDRQPRLALSRGELRRYAGRLWLVAPRPVLAHAYAIARPGRLQLPHGRLAVLADSAGFEPRGPLEVRFRAGGECIRSGGHLRPLKALFQAAGIPPWQRACHPLLFDAEGLVAVPGIAVRDAESAAGGARFRADWDAD
jgi:tRNA(Ile)-lysidine synthase